MNKALSILKKTLKVILWVIIVYILLLLVIAGLIQIPAIQLKVAHFATSFVSDKTHTKVELDKINIKFPKSIVIEGLYLEDLHKDTLIFAGQTKLNISFKDLFNNKLHINSFTLKDANININRNNNDSLFNYNFLLTAFGDTIKKEKSTSSIWTLSSDNAILKNVSLSFDDEYGGMNLNARINHLSLEGASIDLEKQFVSLNQINLFGSQINYSKKDSTNSKKLAPSTDKPTSESNWNIRIKRIDFKDNTVSYFLENAPKVKNSFDASNLFYKEVTLKAENLNYSTEKTEISIKKFSAVDRNNFIISKFETDFIMDQHSITAKNSKVETKNSSIKADFILEYASLATMMDSLQSLVIYTKIKSVTLKNSDILYFVPQLINLDFFKKANTITTASGLVHGSINNIEGKNLVLSTGVNTSLKTDFKIIGLPDVKNASFEFKNSKITSGRKDIESFAGASLPKNIEIPEKINMLISFKGKIKTFKTNVSIKSSFGSANVTASLDKNKHFIGKIIFTNFDLGSLLKDKVMFGPISLLAQINGQGLDLKTLKATIKAEASQFYLNKYTYQNLNIDGKIDSRKFEGKISLNDKNATFDFDGLVNFNPNQESYKFRLNLTGANLQKLNFTKDDIRIGLTANADLKGGKINTINGKASIKNIQLVNEGENYKLDSLLLVLINNKGKSELTIISPIIGLKYSGNISPFAIPAELQAFINTYFPLTGKSQQKKPEGSKQFDFEIQMHNHPILTEVLLPQLKEFEPGIIKGRFDNQKNEFIVIATINKVLYGTTGLNGFKLDIKSDVNAFNYKISCSSVSSSQIKLENLLVEGKLADQSILANISSIDNNKNKKLIIHSKIVTDQTNYKITLDPKEFFLMNDQWDISANNYIKIGKQGFLIHDFSINKSGSQIKIASVNDLFNDDLSIVIRNFKLEDISRIIEKDSSFVKGNVDGNILLKRVNNTYGIIADAQINKLFFQEESIGNIYLKASNPTAGKFDIDINLSGSDNKLTVNGYFIPEGGEQALNLKADIQSLSMNTVKAFSFGQITEAKGNLSGSFAIEGSTANPEVTGELVFNDIFIKPAMLNNRLELKNEKIQIKKDGVYFNSFTMLDLNQHSAIIDGSVKMAKFKDFVFALNIKTTDFQLINTTAKDNKVYFGRMVIDSRIDIKGPLTLPVVNAKLKLKKGSNFTFAVPEEKLSTDKGEDVVEFEDTTNQNSILYGVNKKAVQKSGLTGFDISSIIEIDKQATLKLLMDPASSDSLVVKGEAALSFSIDRSGKMSLTGAYNLNEGSYLVSLGTLVKKKFSIEPGSTIIWNGDPLTADISLNAIYTVRASPIDLVADQMSGLSETDRNSYKLRYPFLVYLKLRGEILKPEISFEIQLEPEDKGILGGAVNAKLNMMNEDPSALNKQVFALLVLGRFIQENPLQSESSGGISTAARTTVSKFLSAQLNQLSSKFVPGVELNFDVQSYEDYQTGEAEGRTQVNIGIKKQLFNERLSVQVGGMVDVEGDKAKQNSASDITSDVALEFKVTKDGRLRLKGFRHNQYEGAIEGQLVETGAGVMYVRDFNRWKNLFKIPVRKNSLSKITNDNDTINNK